MNDYRPDLAFVHDEGFGYLASAGAGVLIDTLERRGLRRGAIFDVGCGSGITARALADRGYSVAGIDLSEPFIEMARNRVPEANFRVGSFVEVEVPPCIAVCAIGEVRNYTFDSSNGSATRRAFFERVYQALVAGGVFLFDTAGPDRAPDSSTRTFFEGQNWAVLVETFAQGGVLTRRIVTFRKCGPDYQRDSEVHRLQLIAPDEIVSELHSVGFEVERLMGYGTQQFPRGLHGFLAWRDATTA